MKSKNSSTMQPIKNLLAPKTVLLIAILYTFIITVAFLLPGRDLPRTQLPLDKIVHIGIHAGLIFLWILYFFRKKSKNAAIATIYYVAIACFVYGIIIEGLQEMLIPMRHLDFNDLIANSVGILLGGILFYGTRSFFENQN
ncbi:VanZ family protein [Marinirhabdus gelatinilytica]|uniref:VanZ like protein n=1 Tax=Marinirhabdus gelatinilytica TaxID=1703343 RepID=A0A370QJB2_9FLAO|nr:VanZ family protein [Marinirhabdus gelatinilytica]RDK88160.1 VanZ like protein [Marinirhabdus gelatinilytica]